MPNIKEPPAEGGAGGSGGEDREGTRGYKPPPKKKPTEEEEEEEELEEEEEEEEETETIVEVPPEFGMEDTEDTLAAQAKKDRERQRLLEQLDDERLNLERVYESYMSHKRQLEDEGTLDWNRLSHEDKVKIQTTDSMMKLSKTLDSQTRNMTVLATAVKQLSKKGGPSTPGAGGDEEDDGIIVRRRRIPPPSFKGQPGERPEAHILRVNDWLEAIGIDQERIKSKDMLDWHRVNNFKFTLDSLAREWYYQYKFYDSTTYEVLTKDFNRYFSTQGRNMKHLHDRWKSFQFNSETDDIEEFVRNIQETGNQLDYGDEAQLNMIKSCMPTAIYSTLYEVKDLNKCITMVKDIFAKNPAAVARQAAVAASATASPFSMIKASPTQGDLYESNLYSISERLNALEVSKPWKPTIAPKGRGRGRG